MAENKKQCVATKSELQKSIEILWKKVGEVYQTKEEAALQSGSSPSLVQVVEKETDIRTLRRGVLYVINFIPHIFDGTQLQPLTSKQFATVEEYIDQLQESLTLLEETTSNKLEEQEKGLTKYVNEKIQKLFSVLSSDAFLNNFLKKVPTVDASQRGLMTPEQLSEFNEMRYRLLDVVTVADVDLILDEDTDLGRMKDTVEEKTRKIKRLINQQAFERLVGWQKNNNKSLFQAMKDHKERLDSIDVRFQTLYEDVWTDRDVRDINTQI